MTCTVIGSGSWVVGKEKIDCMQNSGGHPGVLVSSLLDLTSYGYENLVVKAFEILYRLFNSTHTLLNEAKRAQLIVTDASREFSQELDTNLPVLRRLATGRIEEADSRFGGRLRNLVHLPENSRLSWTRLRQHAPCLGTRTSAIRSSTYSRHISPTRSTKGF